PRLILREMRGPKSITRVSFSWLAHTASTWVSRRPGRRRHVWPTSSRALWHPRGSSRPPRLGPAEARDNGASHDPIFVLLEQERQLKWVHLASFRLGAAGAHRPRRRGDRNATVTVAVEMIKPLLAATSAFTRYEK